MSCLFVCLYILSPCCLFFRPNPVKLFELLKPEKCLQCCVSVCYNLVQVSKISLVDLAGSERADSSGAKGMRLKVRPELCWFIFLFIHPHTHPHTHMICSTFLSDFMKSLSVLSEDCSMIDLIDQCRSQEPDLPRRHCSLTALCLKLLTNTNVLV